jgi:SulP family sulfate permease
VPTRTVGETAPISGSLPSFHVPLTASSGAPGDDHSIYWAVMLRYAFQLALVGIFESVLTLQACDVITETTPSTFSVTQEIFAQGVANTVCGFFGALGGCAMIGQSSVNAMNGARGRLSSFFAGAAVGVYIVLLSALISRIPVGTLAGVLFVVVIHTIQWNTLKVVRTASRVDGAVLVLVTLLAVLVDVATAVLIGLAVCALARVWSEGRALYARVVDISATHRRYEVVGPLFFATARSFTELFDPPHDVALVDVDMAQCELVDYSAVVRVIALASAHTSANKRWRLCNLSARSTLVLNPHMADFRAAGGEVLEEEIDR